MSGFAGIISLDGAPPDALLLHRMAERLTFRGPDGTHISTKPGAGFCFTFLRTGPAPQCASQPCSIDGRVWLLGDVRLDGRGDLRRKLEQHGDEIALEATDEELILRAWRRWGEDSLAGLIGDYSFALWDVETRQLCCARDLMGARPFFYAQAGSRLYFSNTLNAIRCAPGISGALDEHFIGDFLLQGWCSDLGRSAFRDISRLPAGSALHYSTAGLRTRRFASLPIEEPMWLKREEEYVEQFRGLLEQAVLDRLPRGPAAIFMSGGLDSASIASVAVRVAKEKQHPLDLRSYTVDYQPLFHDEEGLLASRAADYIGIPIEVSHVASFLPFADWDSQPPPMPEPCHEPLRRVYLGQVRLVASHSRISFNGYGGDDILTGQTWPYFLYLARRFRLARIARDWGTYIWRHGRVPPLRGGFRATLRQWIYRRDPMAAFPLWLAPEFERKLHLRERWRALHRNNVCSLSHPWYPVAHCVLNSGLWASSLELDDSAWSHLPVDSRSPLLDLRILRFLLRVPPLPLCLDKELLRRAGLGSLPEEIRLRPKVPLAGDPFLLHSKSGRWNPLPLPLADQSILTFVDWQKVGLALTDRKAQRLWSDLAPLALHYWLKSIENTNEIQYSRTEEHRSHETGGRHNS
jgi:asparagine synthase (glutamine-hydrolysing)